MPFPTLCQKCCTDDQAVSLQPRGWHPWDCQVACRGLRGKRPRCLSTAMLCKPSATGQVSRCDALGPPARWSISLSQLHIMCTYPLTARESSSRASRSSMPSVIYLITVSGEVQSSKRMAYPTCRVAEGVSRRSTSLPGREGIGHVLQVHKRILEHGYFPSYPIDSPFPSGQPLCIRTAAGC